MPLERCKKDGRNGWRYGSQGECYTGPGAKKKAIKQGLAIQYKGGEKFKGSGPEDDLEVRASKMIGRRQELMDDVEREILDRQVE